jgi:3-mercaptopyruvate sulfurtransferase SseA
LALKLQRMGITRIRPLLGGYDEWKRRGYPLQDAKQTTDWESTASSVPDAARVQP